MGGNRCYGETTADWKKGQGMIYSFVLREEASIEFAEAYVWYEQQRERLAIAFELAVYNNLDLTCRNPLHYKISCKNITKY
jgi:hypothetical protein